MGESTDSNPEGAAVVVLMRDRAVEAGGMGSELRDGVPSSLGFLPNCRDRCSPPNSVPTITMLTNGYYLASKLGIS